MEQWLIVSAGRGEFFDGVLPVGVGLVESTITLSRFLTGRKVKGVIFVGTIGSYGSLQIGEEVISYSATQIEIGALEKKSYSPLQLEVENRKIEGELSPLIPILPRRVIKINSSNYITTDWELASLFRKGGVEGESMEFYAILETLHRFNLPGFGYFVVTNYTNSSAHSSYLENLPMARKKIGKFVEELKRVIEVVEGREGENLPANYSPD